MYPQAYIDYLVHFHGDRDYFECHEVLEEYWKENDVNNRRKEWVAFIQIAVSLYHQRRGNFSGSFRMMQNALSIIKAEKEAVEALGLDYNKLLDTLSKRLEEIKLKQPYTSITLPIVDQKLLQDCQVCCTDRGLTWGSSSDLSNIFLLNKHSLRDRTDVIKEREIQKKYKSKKNID